MSPILRIVFGVLGLLGFAPAASAATAVSISGEEFRVNGAPTYQGSTVEGLLLNSRMVNAIFDDENPATVSQWAYPDTRSWSAERNVSEFIAALPQYAAKDLGAVTVSLQGGNPVPGCSCDASHNWITSAYTSTGGLKAAWMSRLDRVLTAADQHGIVVILTLFYHGQDQRITSETGIKQATDNVVDWLLAEGHRNVLVEIAGESNHSLTSHAIVKSRVQELIARVQQRSAGQLAASSGFTGGVVPSDDVVGQSDYVVLHGNGQTASSIRAMVDSVRSRPSWRAEPKPIVFTEDSTNLTNLDAAVGKGASWGYHDKGGFQTPPVSWGIDTAAKRGFFDRVSELASTIGVPHLRFEPATLSVPVTQGSGPVSRTVSLETSTGESRSYSMVDDAAWLSVAPATGTSPVNATVTVNPAGLAPGTYNATIRATASGFVEAKLPVTLVVTDPSANAYELRYSTQAHRANAVPLDAATVRGDIFAFTAPDTDVDAVAFWVDDPDRSGPAARTEGNPPYDLGGGSAPMADPYDTTRLPDGPHTLTAALTKVGGHVVVIHATFEVDNVSPALTFTPSTLALSAKAGGAVVSQDVTLSGSDGTTPDYGAVSDSAWLTVSPAAGIAPATLAIQANPAGLAAGTYSGRITASTEDFLPATLTVTLTVTSSTPPPASNFRLEVSEVATRANPRTLEGSTLRGDVFVFVPEDTRIAEVRFHLDNPAATGTPFRTERNAPWDFAGGGSGSAANPWDTTEVPAGSHSITAAVKRTDGATELVTSQFEIAHTPAPDLTPPAPPTATPAAGTYTGAQSVTLAAEAGAVIRYTTEGSEPTTSSPAYAGPIAVADDTTIKAIAIDAAANVSGVATHAYVIEAGPPPPPPPPGYASQIAATPGLAGHWRLDETAGATAADALGRNPGVFENGVVLGQPGALAGEPANRAARFDGSNDQVRVPDAPSLDTGDSFALEAWVRRTAVSSSKVYRVLSKGEANYAFGFTNNFIALRKQGGVDVARSQATLTDTSGWHHIVATKDGASVRLYLDGADVTSPSSIPSPVPAILDTDEALFIGRASNASAAFLGFIDEAAVYDRALSAAEVAANFQAGR